MVQITPLKPCQFRKQDVSAEWKWWGIVFHHPASSTPAFLCERGGALQSPEKITRGPGWVRNNIATPLEYRVESLCEESQDPCPLSLAPVTQIFPDMPIWLPICFIGTGGNRAEDSNHSRGTIMKFHWSRIAPFCYEASNPLSRQLAGPCVYTQSTWREGHTPTALKWEPRVDEMKFFNLYFV